MKNDKLGWTDTETSKHVKRFKGWCLRAVWMMSKTPISWKSYVQQKMTWIMESCEGWSSQAGWQRCNPAIYPAACRYMLDCSISLTHTHLDKDLRQCLRKHRHASSWRLLRALWQKQRGISGAERRLIEPPSLCVCVCACACVCMHTLMIGR